MTELHQAAAVGDFDRVEEILLQNKCNPNQRDIDWSYKTPLHWAAAKGRWSASVTFYWHHLYKLEQHCYYYLVGINFFQYSTSADPLFNGLLVN